MLTPGELAAMSAAMEAARQAVEAAEREAGNAAGWFKWTPVGFVVQQLNGTARAASAAEDRAAVARGLYEALRTKRNELLESPDYDHEASAEVVTLARKLAGHAPAADVRALIGASPMNVLGKSLADTATQAAEGLKLGVPVVLVVALAVGALWLWSWLPKPRRGT